jgi:hypothetical protein
MSSEQRIFHQGRYWTLSEWIYDWLFDGWTIEEAKRAWERINKENSFP